MAETPGFFSREAGLARRRALDEYLNEAADYYLGPTGIPDRLRAVNEFFNPVAVMEDASTAAVRASNPDLPAAERLGAAGESALNVALFGIPGALSARGYIPTVEAATEMLTGIGAASPSVQEAVRATLERLNQPGPMPTLYSNPLPGMGHNGGPPLDDMGQAPAPAALRSRLMLALDEMNQPKGTYGQLRQRLIALGGGAPAEQELAFTGLDRRYSPNDRVTLDELRSYLADKTDMFEASTNVATGTTGGAFDPGNTQYSNYMTPGLQDYFETEYRFTDPGQLYPLGARGLPRFGAHDFGNPEPGFMHVRGAKTVDGMGGTGNTWLMGEIQSDPSQGLRAEGENLRRVPTQPDVEATLLLSESGTARDLPEEVWNRIQDPSFRALGENFFQNRLVLNPDFTPPRAEDFTRAISSAQSQAQDYLRRGAEEVRQMRADLDAEGQDARKILREGLDAEGSYLGYDSASGAMADINQTIRNAQRTGQDPVEFVQQTYDIDPTRSEGDKALSDALRQYSDHSYMSADRQTRDGQMRERSDQLSRYLNRNNDQTEIDYIRRFTDVDAPPSLVRKIEEGGALSPDELDRVYAEEGPVAAASLAARNELGLRNINPNALRDISGYSAAYREGTYTPMPFMESTNQWVDYGLRNQLIEAANSGREYFAISNPKMVLDMTDGTKEGQGKFYGSIVPQRLLGILRGMDKNVKSTTSAEEFKNNSEMVFGPGQIETADGMQDVIMVRLTPELRARIRGEEGFRGLTTFMRPEAAIAGSGLASLALMGEEDSADF